MRKKISMLLLSLMLALLLAACGETEAETTEQPTEENVVEEAEAEEEEEVVVEEIEVPEGMYRSELTNEIISEEIKNQRPIAAMVDNEKTALPHYGINQADVVYEMMNSTLNGRITRLMVLVKDWGNIEQLGSIRSVRPTNILLAAEWNAVLCHDGGPFYIDAYFEKGYMDHFSGGFSRIDNGKAREFTEYIVAGDLESRFANSNVSTEYNEYANEEPHFNFASEANPVDLTDMPNTQDCTKVVLPFEHNGSYLEYNEETQTYDYYEYGSAHVDAGDNNAQTSFKNVIIQDVTFHQYDENGYMIFNCIGEGRWGYYITNGKAMQITWSKLSDTDITRYYDFDGNEITINTGKTYIALCPDDDFPYVAITAE